MNQNVPGAAGNAEDFTKQFMSQMFGGGSAPQPQMQPQQKPQAPNLMQQPRQQMQMQPQMQPQTPILMQQPRQQMQMPAQMQPRPQLQMQQGQPQMQLGQPQIQLGQPQIQPQQSKMVQVNNSSQLHQMNSFQSRQVILAAIINLLKTYCIECLQIASVQSTL